MIYAYPDQLKDLLTQIGKLGKQAVQDRTQIEREYADQQFINHAKNMDYTENKTWQEIAAIEQVLITSHNDINETLKALDKNLIEDNHG